MKKLILALAIATLALATLVASLPLVLSTEAVRSRLVSHFEELTGRTVTFRGDPSVSFSPFLGIEISDFTISAGGTLVEEKPLLSAERVTGKLSLLPALVGRIELSSYRLYRPYVFLNGRQDGTKSWRFRTGSLTDAYDSTSASLQNPESASPYTATLGNLEIVDGAVEYVDQISGRAEQISNLNGNIAWQNTNSPATISGTAVWRNENIKLTTNASSPMQFLAGGTTTINMDFASEPLTYTFSGDASLLPDLFVRGKLQSSSPSIARLSQVLDVDIGTISIIGEWRASGDLEATPQATLLSNALVSIDGKQGGGVVRLARNTTGALKMDGTLAFDAIDLSSYFKGPRAEVAQAINRERSTDLNLDLRLSAKTVTAGAVTLESVASAINLTDGNWKLDIGDSRAFGGSLAARLESTNGAAANAVLLKFSAVDVDMNLLNQVFEREGIALSGRGTVNADLRTMTPITDLRSVPLNGSLEIAATNGQLQGMDLDGLFNSAQSGETINGQKASPETSTSFDQFSMKLFLNNSKATISQASVSSTGGKNIQLLGDIDFLNGTIALRAQESTGNGPGPERLMVGGTLTDPLVSLTIDPNIKPAENTEPESEPVTKEDADG
ncbi:MAG: AsmA family protein [Pseudomonadota bacterium]